MIDKLLGLLNKHSQSFLLNKSIEALPHDLRETAFAVAVDLIFADGNVEKAEKELIENIKEAINIPDDLAIKIVEVMAIKNRGYL